MGAAEREKFWIFATLRATIENIEVGFLCTISIFSIAFSKAKHGILQSKYKKTAKQMRILKLTSKLILNQLKELNS